MKQLIRIFYDGFGDILMNQVGGLIGGAASQGMGMLLQPFMNNMQQQQQQALTNMQEQANEKLSAYNYGQQYDMWLKTNYPAQVEQLEKAGLNPALLYAKGGPGGTTGTPTSGAGMGIAPGQSPKDTAQSVQQAQGMALQTQLLQAQKANIEADTAMKQATAKKTSGVDTDVQQQQLDNMRKQFDNMELDNTMKNIQNYVAQSTIKDAQEYIRAQALKAYNEVQITANQKQISTATVDSAIQTIRQAAISAVIHNSLLRAEVNNTEADTIMKKQEVQNKINDISISWAQMDVNQKAQKAQELAQVMQANNPGISQVLGRELNMALENLYGGSRTLFQPGNPPRK